MNSQSIQIKEGKKSTSICFHCQERREIILVYTHSFYQKKFTSTMITEALNFCWKCVPLLDKNYYLNYGYIISENLLAKAYKSWSLPLDKESKKILTFKIETEITQETIKKLGEKVQKIIQKLGKKIPLKCVACNFDSNILILKRKKCQNNPRCFGVNPKTNKTEFCSEHREFKCKNKNCDYQEWLKEKITTAEPIVKKYGFVKENNAFVLVTKKTLKND